MHATSSFRRIFAALVVVLVGAAAAPAQTVVTLRSSAVFSPPPERLLLGEIAVITGPDAERLAALVLEAEVAKTWPGARTVDIELARVRAALDAANVNWGRTVLRGSTCWVRFVPPEAPATSPATRRKSSGETGPQPVDVSGPPTVRTRIIEQVARLLSAEVADLKLGFREEDAALLSTPATAHRVDIQPTAAANGSRLPLRVYVYSGERIVASGTIPVQVVVRRDVLTASVQIDRRQPITPELTATTSIWLEPNTKLPATPTQAHGALARGRISAGAVIFADDVEAPLAAKRGELIDVHCLSGTVTVKARAVALADAREGETVLLRLEGARKTFTARMDGRRRAVTVLEDAGQPAEN